jgi:small-conductance mechanosensitive channel
MTLRILSLAVGLVLAGLPHLPAQTSATPSTNAPSAKAPAPIAVPDVIEQAQAATATLKNAASQIAPDTVSQQVRTDLPDLTRKLNQRLDLDKRLEQSNPSLSNLQTSQTAWQSISSTLNDEQTNLSERVRDQHTLLGTLQNMSSQWAATLASANKANALPAIVQSIQQVQAQLADTTKALQNDLNDLYALQVEIAHLGDRAKTGADAIDRAVLKAQEQLFEQAKPALWNPAAFSGEGAGVVGNERSSLDEQVDHVRTYVRTMTGALLLHAFLFVILICIFFWIRGVIRERAEKEEALRGAERIFNAPLSNALLLALLASNWFYPPAEAPRLFWATIGALALVPTVIIVRRLISPERLGLLYATVIAYLVDQVRYAATPDGVFARLALLVELLAVCLFILGTLRFRQTVPTPSQRDGTEALVRAYLHAAYFIFLAAVLANILGYVPLSFVIGNGMLDSSYLAVVFYAAVRILDALALASMTVRPIRNFGMVRHNRDLVYEKTSRIIRWTATAAWVVVALQAFSLRNPLWEKASAFLATEVTWPIHVQVGAVVAFPITVWAAFALSRLIRFALEEDVYPNLNLPRGIPYAISTMVHYAILLIGFFIALSAMGINLSSYAVLAGAFGVGLGFGLQNIMNNFISGLILLFERPIKVGDTLQIDATTIGRVERIGIRASVIQLTNGAEVIMPNGNLISNPVTNWTLSNCERLVEIPVNVAPKTDLRHALEVLVAVAKAHSAVLKNPAPHALIVAIAAASTSLKLRCWLDADEAWMQITSDLTLDVQLALEKANITLA